MMYFVRISNEDEIKMHNIADLLVFNCLDVNNEEVLPSVAKHVRNEVQRHKFLIIKVWNYYWHNEFRPAVR